MFEILGNYVLREIPILSPYFKTIQNDLSIAWYENKSFTKQILDNTIFVHNYRTQNKNYILFLTFTLSMKSKEEFSLNGSTIRVVGLADPDYAHQLTFKTLPNGNVEFASGLCLDYLLLLEFALNFTHLAIEGEGWPNRLPNGSWTGLSRQIQSKDADLSISMTSFVEDRLQDFTFLLPLTSSSLSAAFKQPSSTTNLLTRSFKADLWSTLFLSAFLVWLSIKAIRSAQKRLWKLGLTENVLPVTPLNEIHSTNTAYWVLVTFCQRTFVGTPMSVPLRIIYISLTLTSIVAFTAFSATLMSILSIEVMAIKQFSDLIQSDLIAYGDHSAPFTHRFVESIITARKALGRSEDLLTTDVQSGIENIVTHHAMYLTFDGTPFLIYQRMGLSDEFVCKRMSHFKVPGSSIGAGMFVRKGSHLRNMLNPKVIALHESGFVKRLKEKYSSYPKCGVRVKYNTKEPLGVRDVDTSYAILLGGFGLALFFLVFECNNCQCKLNCLINR